MNRFIFVASIAFVFLFSCKNGDDKNAIGKDSAVVGAGDIRIDTFSTFPSEIDGCSCYFAADSVGFADNLFIYMNDFAETSFMKINGEMIKFKQTEFTVIDSSHHVTKAKSDKFQLEIETENGRETGDETSRETGTIKLSNLKGKTVTRKFFGECGC
jgi:catabolite regulation protein CreA